MKTKAQYPRALTIAGSDCGGGAGLQTELKTFSALGAYGMSVITALTAQNTVSVKGVHPCPADFVKSQLDAILEDIGTDAVKTGMLFNSEIISAVAEILSEAGTRNIIVDPVMLAKDGSRLLVPDACETLVTHLLPLADLLTPNIPEAEYLSLIKITDEKSMRAAAEIILTLGPKAVLLKGGHMNDDSCVDLLLIKDGNEIKEMRLAGARVNTVNTHGTGCTLSAAITAELSKGRELVSAVKKAKQYLSKAILAGDGYKLGSGHGPVKHFIDISS